MVGVKGQGSRLWSLTSVAAALPHTHSDPDADGDADGGQSEENDHSVAH